LKGTTSTSSRWRAITATQRTGAVGSAAPDRIVLGCTHFPLVRDLFEAELEPSAKLTPQPRQVALKLADYRVRHPHFANTPQGAPGSTLLNSGRATAVSWRAQLLFSRPFPFNSV
jgi:glutamate racemase